MGFEYINVNQICFMKGYLIHKSTSYEYRESKVIKTLFKKNKYTKEGFYYYDTYISMDEIESNNEFFIKNRDVFRRPYIIVIMSNKEKHTKFFRTNEEMFEFVCNSPLSTIKWINRKEIIESRVVLMEKYKGYPDEYRILSKQILETEISY